MTLRLDFANEQEEVTLPEGLERRLEELLALAGEMESVDAGDVSVTIVDDEAIRELNLQYRKLDKPTDVLSFSMWESAGEETPIVYGDESEGDDVEDGETVELPDEPIGDIVISAATAKRQSEEYGHSFERELGFLFVHGFLHLIGYDHEDEAAERVMTEKQEQVLRRAGLSR
ncbi:rRNA maturation RNase YbeY [Paenibacillus antri]|uniref:Endoribonuclease YbeY n=1 Tax=Paenibacillus antri TaxID=2582848 RepID=A0A5R9G1X2_9BACL|nr:rRNA maturation RNase YbeY [Paenibacillus antri]TLS50347.1 rRNA maturation RNase YbeY [Paenibacillus antri]